MLSYIAWGALIGAMFVVKEICLQLGLVELPLHRVALYVLRVAARCEFVPAHVRALPPLALAWACRRSYACNIGGFRDRWRAREVAIKTRREQWKQQNRINPDNRKSQRKFDTKAGGPRKRAVPRGANDTGNVAARCAATVRMAAWMEPVHPAHPRAHAVLPGVTYARPHLIELERYYGGVGAAGGAGVAHDEPEMSEFFTRHSGKGKLKQHRPPKSDPSPESQWQSAGAPAHPSLPSAIIVASPTSGAVRVANPAATLSV